MILSPRRKEDKGGIICMPLFKNIPNPKNKDWKLTTCPECGRECWEVPLPPGFSKELFDGALCTDCALKHSTRREV